MTRFTDAKPVILIIADAIDGVLTPEESLAIAFPENPRQDITISPKSPENAGDIAIAAGEMLAQKIAQHRHAPTKPVFFVRTQPVWDGKKVSNYQEVPLTNGITVFTDDLRALHFVKEHLAPVHKQQLEAAFAAAKPGTAVNDQTGQRVFLPQKEVSL